MSQAIMALLLNFFSSNHLAQCCQNKAAIICIRSWESLQRAEMPHILGTYYYSRKSLSYLSVRSGPDKQTNMSCHCPSPLLSPDSKVTRLGSSVHKRNATGIWQVVP
ncbi:uncharacterized protein EDB91DRAFT_355213 [Suillus paluster]|uniref:uncharacterized protein n=1 Tax=Suillus paluster TaxID=48578 RepID=UPI001B85D39C|nr:uncharacterized protein EDB91DRAFT_355213 [Suillus paluster]KAG1740540.1 hypothetical protein EDB91DRAFT_355213 [Suillus paluster]